MWNTLVFSKACLNERRPKQPAIYSGEITPICATNTNGRRNVTLETFDFPQMTQLSSETAIKKQRRESDGFCACGCHRRFLNAATEIRSTGRGGEGRGGRSGLPSPTSVHWQWASLPLERPSWERSFTRQTNVAEAAHTLFVSPLQWEWSTTNHSEGCLTDRASKMFHLDAFVDVMVCFVWGIAPCSPIFRY